MSLDLPALLEEWQGILRLRDWDLSIAWAKGHELGPNCEGDSRFSEEHRAAHLRVLREEDSEPGIVPPYNAEQTIIHELLHIPLAGWARVVKQNMAESYEMERAINDIARALLALKHGKGVESWRVKTGNGAVCACESE